MIGTAISQFEGFRPSMGGSVILTHSGIGIVRAEVKVLLMVERVMRLVGGLVIAVHETERKWRE